MPAAFRARTNGPNQTADSVFGPDSGINSRRMARKSSGSMKTPGETSAASSDANARGLGVAVRVTALPAVRGPATLLKASRICRCAVGRFQ